MKDTFCAVPWIQLSTKPNGNIRTCCLMTNSNDPEKGVLKRTDGSIYNAKDEDYLDSINAEKAKSLRLDLLSGVKNPLCKTCWDKESIGLKSKRIITNRDFKDQIDIDRAREITDAQGTVSEYKLAYLDLRFGNLCNLKCIMCHPSSSSAWYSDYVELSGEEHFYDTGEKIYLEKQGGVWAPKDKNKFKWFESEEFWKTLESHIEDVKQIYLVGGEPLLINQHFKFLEFCVEKNLAKNIRLEYDTNLTITNDKIIGLWKNFKEVKLRVSIESIGKQNDYIRFPSDWQKIEDNLEHIKDSCDNVKLEFSITWQIYNLFSITDIWDKFPNTGSVRTLSSPEYLDIKILPEKLKQKALEHLESYPSRSERISNQIESMIEYLKSNMNYQDKENLIKFKNYTKSCDQIRGTSFRDTFPELSELA